MSSRDITMLCAGISFALLFTSRVFAVTVLAVLGLAVAVLATRKP